MGDATPLQAGNGGDTSEGVVEDKIIAKIGRSIHQPFRCVESDFDWFQTYVPAISSGLPSEVGLPPDQLSVQCHALADGIWIMASVQRRHQLKIDRQDQRVDLFQTVPVHQC